MTVKWDSLMAQAAQNMDVLGNSDNIKILANVLKTNVAACTSIGSFYLPQIGRIFMDMLGLYKAVSAVISETVARDGAFRNNLIGHLLDILLYRFDCDENAEDSTTANCEKRSSETYGDLHPKSRGPGGRQLELHATSLGCDPWRLQCECSRRS